MIDAGWYQRPRDVQVRDAAGGVVVRVKGDGVLVAFAREVKNGGLILPKGGIERGETEEQAARREVAEEAGFDDLVLLGDLGMRERLSFNRKRWTRTHYYLFRTNKEFGIPTDRRYFPPEWFPIDQLPDLFWPEQRELIETNRPRIIELARS
jgi:8-oxo-dGTP pyrophosphatase MutT (NUDIX family)